MIDEQLPGLLQSPPDSILANFAFMQSSAQAGTTIASEKHNPIGIGAQA